jgi:Flp pilus assembly protein TadG
MVRQRRLQRPGPGRRGAVSVYLIVSLPALVLAVLVGINAGYLVEARTTLQNSADAAALAGAQGLVDDRTLLDDPRQMEQVIDEARQAAIAYAEANPALGDPVVLEPNLENDPEGDIVFAALETPRDKHLVVIDLGAKEFLKETNTVRVTARRTEERGNPINIMGGPFLTLMPTDAVIRSTATLDRDVVGFRPAGRIPVPLVPVALLSDPTGKNRDSWEFQVEHHGGGDHWRFDRDLYLAVRDDKGGDGLFEMKVNLGSAPRHGDRKGKSEGKGEERPNACLLLFGAGDTADLFRQITSGLTEQDLQQLGGELRLGVDNKRASVPGVPWGPGGGSAESQLLLRALEELRLKGAPRVWPLFQGMHPDSGMPVLTGFVAARVVDVRWGQAGSKSSQAGSNLSFTVQPCAMSTVTALTDPGRRGLGEAVPNRYVCKVRLVE